MENRRKWLRISALILVFGVFGIVNVYAQTVRQNIYCTISGRVIGIVYAQADTLLNGTWVATTVSEETMRIVEKAYRQAGVTGAELQQLLAETRMDMLKAETRMNNGNFELVVDGVANGRGTYTTNNGKLTTRTTHLNGGPMGLASRWYTIKQLTSLLLSVGVPREMVNAAFTTFALEEIPSDYSVTGNTLTTTHPVGGVGVYTRK